MAKFSIANFPASIEIDIRGKHSGSEFVLAKIDLTLISTGLLDHLRNIDGDVDVERVEQAVIDALNNLQF